MRDRIISKTCTNIVLEDQYDLLHCKIRKNYSSVLYLYFLKEHDLLIKDES